MANRGSRTGSSIFLIRAKRPARPGRRAATGLRSVALASSGILLVTCAQAAFAGQLPASAFQAYNPASATGITPGPLALYSVPVGSIAPTQASEGYAEVGKKTAGFDLLTPAQLQANLLTSIEPVVIGPGGQLYLTDGHHTFTALDNSIYGASNPTVYVDVIANYSTLTTAQFYATMQARNFLLPLNDGVPETVTATGAPLPTSLTGLTNDPYRGLEYSILKNKSSALFKTTANITGAVGASTPGLDKMSGYYLDFFEAAAYRAANGGLGLPTISPGDIALATQWNLNAASATTLPNVAGTVTAAQLPGFILAKNIVNAGGISNATLATGAIDGNGGFTGLTTINAGTTASPITIGSPNVGLVMQLGADRGFSVTLNGTNSYTGGTSILAGTLIAQSDASLGAATPAGATIDPNNVLASVQAANGIIFNSLSEGNGTLTLGSTAGGTFATNRPIAVGSEAATINLNGHLTTLTGQLISLGTAGIGIGNATGFSDLTIDDTSTGGRLILATSSPNFYGNIIVGSSGAPTVTVMNDAALGNTTGSPLTIGQVDLNGGTLQAGASFAAPERNLFLGSGSTIDVNGFATSWGTLTDVQRTITIQNGNTGTAGAITFNNLTVGAAAILQLAGGAAGESVTLTNGVQRTAQDTLVIQPTSAASLGAGDKLFSGTGASSLVNGIAPVWIVENNGVSGGGGPYDFVSYGSNGYVKASYGATTLTSGGANSIVALGANTTATGNVAAYALNTEGKTIALGGNTLTLGNGSNPAGLILASGTSISGGTLAFGAREGVVWLSGSNPTISAAITGSGGLTFSGSGTVGISTAANVGGLVTVDAGTVTLSGANIFAGDAAGILLDDTKSKPSFAALGVTANNMLTTLNTVGTNSQINISNGAALTLGDMTNNLSSTISAVVKESGAATAGVLTLNGSGLFDFSAGKSFNLVSGSTIVANNSARLRVVAADFVNANFGVVLNGTSQLQFAQNGGGVFANTVSGTGALHLIGGTLQITGTANSYSGGTIVETGSTLDVTTANLPAANPNIADAGGLVLFDQATNGTYAGVISDGLELGTGPLLAGSLDKDDSTGGNGGNVTLAQAQQFTGKTYVEAGTLTLGAADTLATSSGVDLGRVGGGATATLALTANNGVQGLGSEAGNTTSVQLGANALTIRTAAGASNSFGGVIAGAGSVTVAGAGAQLFSGANSYTGGTIVTGGTLALTGAGTLGATGGVLGVSGGTLDLGGTSQTTGALNLTGGVIQNGTLTATAYNAQGGTVSAALAGAGALTASAGTTTLSGANSYAGGTTVTGGTLALTGAGTLGATGGVLGVSGGTLDLGGTSQTTGALNLTGGVIQNGTLTATAYNAQGATVSAALAGAGALTASAGTTTLSGANSYAGGTTVTGGTLALTGAGTLGATGGVLGVSGGTLDLGGTSQTTGALTLTGGTVQNGTLASAAYGVQGGTVSASLAGSGVLTASAGTTTLSGANSYTGGTAVTGGTLALTGAGTLGATGGALGVSGGTLDLGGTSQTTGALTLTGGTVQNGTLDAAAFNVQSGTVSAVFAGTGALTKTGAGTVTLSGVDTYTGTTDIQAGTLRLGIDNALSASTALTVETGATLDLNTHNDTVGSFALFGTLTGGGILSANTTNLYGGALGMGLSGTTVNQVSGATMVTGTIAATNLVVTGGTLQLEASDRIADATAVTVNAAGTFDLQGNSDTVASLAVSGTLVGTGTLTAASYSLDGATVTANLGAGLLTNVGGASTLGGTAGAATVAVNGGSLTLGASNRLADDASLSVASGAALNLATFSDTVGTASLAGTLAGTGTLTAASYSLNGATVSANLGRGALTNVGGVSTLNGMAGASAVEVAMGTLRLGATQRLAATAALTLDAQGTLDLLGFNQTVDTATLSGTLLGTGTLTAASYALDGATVTANLGAGTLTNVGGVSTLDGTAGAATVAVNAGTLTLGASNRLADNAALTVASGATLDMGAFTDTVGTATLAGTLSGSGTLTAASYALDGVTVTANLGAGTLTNVGGVSTLDGTAGAATVAVNAGTLTLGASNRLADNAALTVSSGATLDMGAFTDTVGTATLAGTLSGIGTLTAASYALDGATVTADLGAGALTNVGGVSTLAGTAAAATDMVEAGTLRLGASQRLASGAALAVASGATFDLAGYGQSIASLAGSGTVALGAGTLTDGGTNAASSFTGNLSGTGTFAKTGTGMLTLTGAESLTGSLAFDGGTTLFTGSTAGGVRVDGGTLTGNATVAGNLALASGTLSPGATSGAIGSFSAGSLTVSGGTLAFDAAGSTGNFASDTIKVAGAATLSGGTVAISATEPTANYHMTQDYVLVQAGSVSGSFANGGTFAQTSNDSGLYYRLRYDLVPDEVLLELRKQVDFTQGLGSTGTANQYAVANALNGGALTGSDAYVGAVSRIADETPAQQAATFSSLSGESVANITTAAINASNRFVDMLRDRISIGGATPDDPQMLIAGLFGRAQVFQQARVGATTQAAGMGIADGQDAPFGGADRHVGFWVQGFGAAGTLDGQSGTAKLTDSSTGIAAGLDAQIGPFRIGAAFAADHLDTKLRTLASTSQGTVHQGAGYLAYDDGHAYANLIGSYFDGSQASARQVFVGGSSIGTASGRPDLDGWSGAGAAGYRIAFGNDVRLTPQIEGGFTHVKRDAFSENGIGVFSLDVAEDRRTTYTAGGELRLSKPFALGGGTVEPYVSGGVVFNLGDRDATSAMTFDGAPTGTGAFTVDGAKLPREAARLTGGLQVQATTRVSFGVGAEALLANRQHEGALNMHVRIGF